LQIAVHMSFITGTCQRTETEEIDTVVLFVREDYQMNYPAGVVTSLGSSNIQKLPRITLSKQYYYYLRCENNIAIHVKQICKIIKTLVCM
jgi:hypothetical protein